MVRRTKEDAQATRDLILDTAELVFQRRGVSRTSLQEIAQEAGLTRGAIYWHFQNKAAVFNAMMQRVILPMEAHFIREPVDAPGDPLDQVRHNVAGALRLTVHDPKLRRVFEIATYKVEYVDELLDVRERHVAERKQCLQDLERVLAQAMERGQIRRNISPTAAAVGLHALIDGLLQNWLLDTQAFDLEVLGAQVLNAYLAGLATPST